MTKYEEKLNKLQWEKVKLEKWYLEDHLTLAEIGELLGVTRQSVFEKVKRCHIDVSTAERFKVKCDLCGNEYETTRKRWRKSIMHFCSMKCNGEYKRNDEYVQWRNGQRIGRVAMEEVLKRELKYGEVVHHIDGNNGNNDLSNLMVFKSSSDHMKYHHEERRNRITPPVIDGPEVS